MKKLILMALAIAGVMSVIFANSDMSLAKAIVSGLAFGFGIVPFLSYAQSIVQWHKTGVGTEPSKVTLIIWATLDIFMFASYYIANGWNTMTYMLLAYMLGAISVSYLALKYGSWGADKKTRRESFIVLGGAGIGLLAWWFFHSASIGHYLFILTLSISVLPLIKKVYQKPWSEDLNSWLMWFMANNFTLFSILYFDGWTIENGLLTGIYFVLYLILLFPMLNFVFMSRKVKKIYTTKDTEGYFKYPKSKVSNFGTKVARHLGMIEEDESVIFYKDYLDYILHGDLRDIRDAMRIVKNDDLKE